MTIQVSTDDLINLCAKWIAAPDRETEREIKRDCADFDEDMKAFETNPINNQINNILDFVVEFFVEVSCNFVENFLKKRLLTQVDKQQNILCI